MTLPYGFERNNIPESYTPLTWEDFRERTMRDYGEPHKTNPATWDEITDWERSPEHDLATIF